MALTSSPVFKARLVFAIWFYGMASYLDRISLSFAGPVVMHDLALPPATFGMILSSFAIGYVIAQVPGGLIADKWGCRAVLIAAPLIWAALSGLTGLATTAFGFIVARAGLGLSEGMAQGPAFKVQGDHFSTRERPILQGITLTPIAMAPAIAAPFASYIISAFGWRWIFFLLALPSVIAALINYLYIPGLANGERSIAPAVSNGSGRRLLRQPNFWLLALTWLSFNIAYWGYQGWMPSYLVIERHVDIHTLGMLGGLPYLFGFLGLIAFGYLGATVMHGRYPLLLITAFFGAGAALFGAYVAETLTGSVIGLSASAFFLFGGLGIFYTTVTEHASAADRGIYWGAVGAAGQIGGVLAPSMIGLLVGATGKFASGFSLMVVALGFAAICTFALGYRRSQELRRNSSHPPFEIGP